MNTYILKKNIKTSTFQDGTSSNGIWYNLILFLFLGIILYLILWVKMRNVGEFSGDYLLIGYTIFLTTFQMLRLVSALFYRQSLNHVTSDLSPARQQELYEPKVTFVVPCKNEEEAIHTTISKCFEAEYPREKIEVIVINDGSTDRTGEILNRMKAEEYPDLNIIHWVKNKGKREGMNAGFRLARGEIIIQLDSDSYIIPETFRKLIEPFKNPEIGAVCAHADPENASQNWMSKMQAAYYFMSFRVLKAAESTFGIVFCCSGCSSAYRKSVVLPVLDSWLQETFMGKRVTWGDDRALTSYVIKTGHKTIYTDLAKAVTIVPTTFKQLLTQQTRWKKSWIINALFTGRFIWRTDPFVAFFYYYPLIIISILTPIMAARAIFYTPIFVNSSSFGFYLFGGAVVTALLVIFCKFAAREFKYWPYLFLWSAFNIFILSFIFFYAGATIQNRSWGTR
ncbi:MAG: glycosyltransferase [Candidatus Paceibacterota bacterium]